MEIDAFHRASLYVSLHTYLKCLAEGSETPVEILNFFESLDVKLPRKISPAVSEYFRNYRAGAHRDDLQPSMRAHLANHIAAFYRSLGYEVDGPADSLAAMTAFAARLAIDAYFTHLRSPDNALMIEKSLHRFTVTHLIPALLSVRPPDTLTADAVQSVTRLLKDDLKTLARMICGGAVA